MPCSRHVWGAVTCCGAHEKIHSGQYPHPPPPVRRIVAFDSHTQRRLGSSRPSLCSSLTRPQRPRIGQRVAAPWPPRNTCSEPEEETPVFAVGCICKARAAAPLVRERPRSQEPRFNAHPRAETRPCARATHTPAAVKRVQRRPTAGGQSAASLPSTVTRGGAWVLLDPPSAVLWESAPGERDGVAVFRQGGHHPPPSHPFRKDQHHFAASPRGQCLQAAKRHFTRKRGGGFRWAVHPPPNTRCARAGVWVGQAPFPLANTLARPRDARGTWYMAPPPPPTPASRTGVSQGKACETSRREYARAAGNGRGGTTHGAPARTRLLVCCCIAKVTSFHKRTV